MVPAVYTVNQMFYNGGRLGIQPQIKKVKHSSIPRVFIVIFDMFKPQYFYYDMLQKYTVD